VELSDKSILVAQGKPHCGVSPVTRQRAKELRRLQTEEESILWERLRRNRLNRLHFRRQEPLVGFIVDFYCHEARLIVEVDGSIHTQADQAAYDVARGEALSAYGLQLLRITNAEIRGNLESALKRIEDECSQRISKRSVIRDIQ